MSAPPPGQESMRDLAAAYALGALSAEEAERFEAFLASSPETQREVAELRDAAALLAVGQVDVAPSADLRDRMLARIRQDTVVPISQAAGAGARRTRVFPVYWGALAASFVAVAALAWSLAGLRDRVTDLQQTVATRDAALAERQRMLDEREATLDRLLEPGVKLYQLTASGDPEPGIQLFWNQQRNTAIIHGYRLKPVPSGREYQLWFIKDGKPVPSVTFKPEPDGHAKVEQIQVPAGGALSAAAVTVEPAGGSPQPTSPILLVAALPS
jgi:anti-sigma-K factor RskA